MVISAHYDHLGDHDGEIYYGADDNGSGSASLLNMLAAFKKMSDEGYGPKRSVLFVWMTGEESGLLGSEYYVNYPIFPLQNTVCNLNIDMIGRHDKQHNDGSDPYVYVIGSDKLSSDLHKLNEKAALGSSVKLDYTFNDENDPNRFYYRSDHYNFAKKGIPVIFYFSGVHDDYHKPTDVVEKIEFEKMAEIVKLVYRTAYEVANAPERIRVDSNKK